MVKLGSPETVEGTQPNKFDLEAKLLKKAALQLIEALAIEENERTSIFFQAQARFRVTRLEASRFVMEPETFKEEVPITPYDLHTRLHDLAISQLVKLIPSTETTVINLDEPVGNTGAFTLKVRIEIPGFEKEVLAGAVPGSVSLGNLGEITVSAVCVRTIESDKALTEREYRRAYDAGLREAMSLFSTYIHIMGNRLTNVRTGLDIMQMLWERIQEKNRPEELEQFKPLADKINTTLHLFEIANAILDEVKYLARHINDPETQTQEYDLEQFIADCVRKCEPSDRL